MALEVQGCQGQLKPRLLRVLVVGVLSDECTQGLLASGQVLAACGLWHAEAAGQEVCGLSFTGSPGRVLVGEQVPQVSPRAVGVTGLDEALGREETHPGPMR